MLCMYTIVTPVPTKSSAKKEVDSPQKGKSSSPAPTETSSSTKKVWTYVTAACVSEHCFFHVQTPKSSSLTATSKSSSKLIIVTLLLYQHQNQQ